MPVYAAARMPLSVIAGALMLACSGGEVTTAEPPVFEPVLQVNGHTLSPFYTGWNPPDGDPEFGNIMVLSAGDIVRITLVDGIDTFRTVDLWVFDQRPSETSPRLAEATCSTFEPSPHRLYEHDPDTALGPIKLLECAMDSKDTRLVVDVSELAQRCSMLYMVVPVIWWPVVEPEGIVYPDFRTASWAFSIRGACGGDSGADDVVADIRDETDQEE